MLSKLPKTHQFVKRPHRFILSKLNHSLNSFYPAGNPKFCWKVNGTTFFRKKMTLCLPEVVSFEIYRKGYFEAELSRLLISCLDREQVFVDIGAHFGFFTLLASELVGNSGEIHTFEPTPSTFKILEQNVGNLKQVRINHLAVFSSITKLSMNDFGFYLSAYNSFGTIKMNLDYAKRIGVKNNGFEANTCTLDNYFSNQVRRPNFIKIDAESAELEILKGMVNILSKDRPLVTLEVGDVNDSTPSKTCVEFMREFDYSPFELDADTNMLKAHIAKDTYGWDNLLFVPIEKVGDIKEAFESTLSER
jgi:FkbM family methyltransferase